MSAANLIVLAEVRQALAERFPSESRAATSFWKADWPVLDGENGAIAFGAIAEICGAEICGRLFLGRVLATARRQAEWVALVEAGRSFDFENACGAGWEKVLTVFARDSEQAVKAADLLLRDGNVPLVLLDLQTAPRRSLGRIPASTWHRFQRLVEKSGTALVVLTPQPMVEAARVRIALRGRWDLAALCRPRAELLAQMDVQVFHRGRAAQPSPAPLAQTA